MTKTTEKKLLLLTLVHPDFLPPVYAIAQVLRDLGFTIHILTFDSFVPSHVDIGDNIEIESVGKHHDISFRQRLKLRSDFTKRAAALSKQEPVAIISFCAFSFLCGLKVRNNIPFIYHAIEVADFIFKDIKRSPLSQINNLLVLQQLHKADLVATPSVQRSAWLAGRCHLSFMPYTICNTPYLQSKLPEDTAETFNQIIPKEFAGMKIILYTGAVNSQLCILELVEAFELLNDQESVLIITGIKDNAYCRAIKEFVVKSNIAKRTLLLPYVTRGQMLALQSNAHIGVCLAKEYPDHVESKMMAGNKIGEYLGKGLYLLGTKTEYLKPMEMMGIASLAEIPTPEYISVALEKALIALDNNDFKIKIKNFVDSYFCMQEQSKPIINYLNDLTGKRIA